MHLRRPTSIRPQKPAQHTIVKQIFDSADSSRMNFEDLIGQIFLEGELYDRFLIELEANFEKHIGIKMLIYFDRINEMKIRISDVVRFTDGPALDREERANIEKREWFELYNYKRRYYLILVRMDRSGWLASIGERSTGISPWRHAFLDLPISQPPLTEEEKRRGYMELAGLLEEQIPKTPSKNTKAVREKPGVQMPRRKFSA